MHPKTERPVEYYLMVPGETEPVPIGSEIGSEDLAPETDQDQINEELAEIIRQIREPLTQAMDAVASAFSQAAAAITDMAKAITDALNKGQVNNWRKFHGLPMRRKRRRRK